MTKFKIFLLIIFLLLPNILYAWKWYDVWGTLSWWATSWNKICPSWKSLLWIWANKNSSLAINNYTRSWTATCYRPDNTPPNITIIWDTSWKWTKSWSVTLTVNINDTESWLWKVEYSIGANSQITVWSSNFDITFTEEWRHVFFIKAEDKAINDSFNWTSVSPNTITKTVVINIDRTAPIFTKLPDSFSNSWINNKPNLTFIIDDKYKWKDIISKTFDCWILPNNSTWWGQSPNWKIDWWCETTSSNLCGDNIDYYPNDSLCSYECKSWYTKWNDWNCYDVWKEVTCDSTTIPLNVFIYNKNETIIPNGSSEWKILWNNPFGVNPNNWKFIASYIKSSNSYTPTIGQCWYECAWWFHNEWWKCISDTKIVCCNNPELSYSTLWARTDCTKAENQGKVECSYSSLCWYDKELFSSWSNFTNNWIYETSTDWVASKANHCWYNLYSNSNLAGTICSPGYYLYSSNWKPIECDSVPSWEFSWLSNNKNDCTNKPAYSYYTSWSTSNNCSWQCESWYKKVWNSCVIDIPEWTSCWDNKCTYSYQKTYYKDKVCSEIDSLKNVDTSQEFDKLEDCQKEENKEDDINICKGLNGNESKKKMITQTCLQNFNSN